VLSISVTSSEMPMGVVSYTVSRYSQAASKISWPRRLRVFGGASGSDVNLNCDECVVAMAVGDHVIVRLAARVRTAPTSKTPVFSAA